MKYLTFLLFLFVAFSAKGQSDYYSKSDSLGIDTLLSASTMIGSKRSLTTPVFYATSSGLYEFSIHPNISDYGWYSKLMFSPTTKLKFAEDTTTVLRAKYDYGMDYTHWFTTQFNRNVGKSKVAVNFDRNYADNLYLNTEGERSNFDIGSIIEFSNNYSVEAGYFISKLERSENGGILDVNAFKEASAVDEFNIEGKLSSAKSNIFYQGAVLNQKILLFSKKDSLGKELSSIELSLNSMVAEHRISFSMDEADIDAGYFTDVFYDTLSTFDSTGYKQLKISPVLKFNFTNYSLDLGYSKEYYDNSILDRSNVFLGTEVRLPKSLVSLAAEYGLESYWKDNYKLDISYYSRIRGLDFLVGMDMSSTSPEYSFHSFSSNHYLWEMEIESINVNKVYFKLRSNKYRTEIKGDIATVDNYLFFNSKSTLIQNSNLFYLGTIALNNTVGNEWIRLTSGVGLQKSSSDVAHIPTVFSKNTLEFNFSIRNVPFTIGGTAIFFSKYAGNNFDPALRHYTLSDKMVGGIPIFDAFFAARVGGANIYIKYDNFLYESNGRLLFVGEDQPIAKPLFRAGLSWKLVN